MAFTKHDLDIRELMLLSSAMREREKSLALGYLMLIGGHLGIHRFYLKRYGSAALQLILFAAAMASYIFMILSDVLAPGEISLLGLIPFLAFAGALTVWVIIDLFLLPGMIRSWNEQAERETIEEIVSFRQSRQP